MRIWRVLVALAIALMSSVPAPLTATPLPQGEEPMTIRVITFTRYPPLEAAQELGYFADEGLNVEVEVTPSSTAQMQGLAAGRWDVAITAFDNLLASATREGVQSVALAVSANQDLALWVRPEIQGYEDLRGQRIAVDAIDTAFALVLRKLLLAHGLDFDRGDYELIVVGGTPERLASMQQADTVAAILLPPVANAAEQAGMQRLGDYSEVLPGYVGNVVAVTRPWLDRSDNRDAMVRFLRAWLRGATWAADPENRDAAGEMLVRRQNISRPAAEALLDTIPDDLALQAAGLQAVLDLRVGFGFVAPPGPPIQLFFDTAVFEDAQAE